MNIIHNGFLHAFTYTHFKDILRYIRVLVKILGHRVRIIIINNLWAITSTLALNHCQFLIKIASFLFPHIQVHWGGRWEERVFNWTLSLPGWLLPCTALRSPFPPELPVGVAMGFFPCPPQPLYTPDDPHKQQAWHTSLHFCLQGIWPKDKCYQTKYRTGPWLGGWGEMQLNSRARFWLPWWLSW